MIGATATSIVQHSVTSPDIDCMQCSGQFSVFSHVQWPRPASGVLTKTNTLSLVRVTVTWAAYSQVHFHLSVFAAVVIHSTHDSTLSLVLPTLPRYSREPGRKGTPALHYDHPADQPAGAAPGRPRRAEEAGRLADGETEATNGASSPATGTSKSFPVSESWPLSLNRTQHSIFF